MIDHRSAGGIVFIISPFGAGSVSYSDKSPLRWRARPGRSSARQQGIIVVEIIHRRRRVSRLRPSGSGPRIDLRFDAIERIVVHSCSNSTSVRLLYGVAVWIVGIPY